MEKYQLQNVTLDDATVFSAYIVIEEDWNGFALPYFMLSEAKKLCAYLNSGRKDKWTVVNLTDGIEASGPMTKTNAENFISQFPLRFKEQGYYVTANGERIKPEEVKLIISSANPEGDMPESFYDEKSDTFIIQEQIDGDEYEPVEYSGEDIFVNGEQIRVYPIGTGSWIWTVDTQLN